MIGTLLDAMLRGDRLALSRLLSYSARGEHLAEIRAGLADIPPRAARVVAFTGSGGVGKSSLLGKLIPLVRGPGLKVAVLACDPQSPVSGGALLGDRFRMGSAVDDGVLIRSLAALSGHGAVADHLPVMIRLLETFGFDVIFLETVGSGQGDVQVRDLADAVVLLLQPESGDDVQWEKAGILECADVVAVHKADLPTAEQTAAQVRSALDLSPVRQVLVLLVSSRLNRGLDELWQAIESLPLRRGRDAHTEMLWQEAMELLRSRLQGAQKRNDPTLTQVRTPAELVRFLLGAQES
jgi:LAO/AO transport system ATPase